VLPFSLYTALPRHAFTKFLRPLGRSQGLRALLYLDDGFVAVEGKEAVLRASERVRRDLARAGLVEHTAKCTWEPQTKDEWLDSACDLLGCQWCWLWRLYYPARLLHSPRVLVRVWKNKESTRRELRKVRMVLESLVPKLKNQQIHWFSDNQNVVRIGYR